MLKVTLFEGAYAPYSGDFYHTKFFLDDGFEALCDYLVVNQNFKLYEYDNYHSLGCIGCGKEIEKVDDIRNIIGNEYCCKECDEKEHW